jgi:hypothetical protein
MKYDTYIGIDTGVTTGFSVWDAKDKKLTHCCGLKIHKAMEWVLQMTAGRTERVLVRFEDARLRKWFGKAGREQLQGAGSVKRDAVIWEDFCKEKGIQYERVAPKDNKTKLNAATFKAITKWVPVTNEHARDSAMLVFGK